MIRTNRSADEVFESEWPKIESKIRTMASKLFLPGLTIDDLMQEFRTEAFIASQVVDESKSSVTTLMWKRILNKRSDLMRHYFNQSRDATKERYALGINGHDVSDEFDGHPSGTGHKHSEVQITDMRDTERIGNASKFHDLLDLDLDDMTRRILLLRAADFNVNETVDIIREQVDPEFDHNAYYRIFKKLRKLSEVADLLAA